MGETGPEKSGKKGTAARDSGKESISANLSPLFGGGMPFDWGLVETEPVFPAGPHQVDKPKKKKKN